MQLGPRKTFYGLRYAGHIPDDVIEELEIAAECYELDERRLELLGQDEDLALEFVSAVEDDRVDVMLGRVDWNLLERLFDIHRRCCAAA